MRLPQARLDQVLDRFREIEARMGAATDGQEIVRLSKEHAELKPVADAVMTLARVRAEAPELEEMAAAGDPEMAAMARDELQILSDKLPALEHEVALLLAPKDKDENASAILEVRAGTGGDEAALFAGDLFRMYQRYATLHGWRVEIDSVSEGEVGGYKEIIASVTGDGVFGRLKFESGVHRVQRVPDTEAGGRIHTSAATVAVLPEVEDVEIDINPSDLRIDTYRSSGAGGQHVNKTDSAVRITHLPTGIVVTSSEKSQHQNRARALKVLQARLYDQQREALDTARADARKSQVGSGDRSERIRTYNFPQGRVTDHRINLTLYNLARVIAGDELDDVINPLIAEDQAARLSALEDEFG
ncbi:MAG: peptide chain release factor 1 [Phenylobacterium sp.]|uniref:peptide chain release factor 1 n=1 Tax=Phenylobacterium sp. TaxID=1871053 RepID=UPI001B44CC48|nr:peptide chain release factor 1 [Phenylobacterium sp.]MBP7817998.1 peptide chain release factor 1 [Phenylobacterium sp.]MBP9230876.1 peptide chain release factor 1 [Phenylobacterium sp.]MBP9754688.1 peptide chain release factor 1 [Phenylobacterium sp.]